MNQPKSRTASQLLLTAPFARLTAALVLLSGIPAMAAPPTTVYAGGSGGVYRSTDGGITWTNLLSGVEVGAIAIDPLNPEVIYAGSNSAVYKTTNGGADWTRETNGLSGATIITTLQIDPANPNTVYVGAGDFAPGGVYKSTDRGVNWTTMDNGLTCFGDGCVLSVLSLSLDTLNPNTIYAGGNTGLNSSKTTNGAASWTSVNFPGAFALTSAINPVNDQIVFMAGPFGMYYSLNGATTWNDTNLLGLSYFIQSMTIDPNTPSTMYAGAGGCTTLGPPAQCNSTIYQSTNTGVNWTAIGALLPPTSGEQVRSLVVDPADSSTLYAAGVMGIWQSTNSGLTWTLVDPITGGASAVAMAPNARQTATFNVLETVAQALIALAEDFKRDPTIACGILKDYLKALPGLVQAGLLSSTQSQALTLQIQNAEASIPCS
jgi:photosystem II stability/assembly factor-like uncharacterized protein